MHKLAVLHRYVVIFLSACLVLDAVVCLQRECGQAATSSPIEPELDYWDGPLLLLFVANVHNALLGLLWHTSRKPLQKRWREKPLSYVAHYIIMIQVCESVQS